MDSTEVSLIINYDLPVSAETYTKRLVQHFFLGRGFTLHKISHYYPALNQQ